jgi:hypothetical protein
MTTRGRWPRRPGLSSCSDCMYSMDKRCATPSKTPQGKALQAPRALRCTHLGRVRRHAAALDEMLLLLLLLGVVFVVVALVAAARGLLLYATLMFRHCKRPMACIQGQTLRCKQKQANAADACWFKRRMGASEAPVNRARRSSPASHGLTAVCLPSCELARQRQTATSTSQDNTVYLSQDNTALISSLACICTHTCAKH